MDAMHQSKNAAVNVTVLSEADAAGLYFDKVWMLGMTAVNFPKMAKPNPLLDRQSQIDLNIPHASAEQELLYAQKITTIIAKSTEFLMFSTYKKEKGRELVASPIMSRFAQYATATEVEHPITSYVNMMSDNSKCELIKHCLTRKLTAY
jgi:hypothetical protein